MRICKALAGGQTPQFNEHTIVLKGILQVKTKEKTFQVCEGQATFILKNEWVQYSSPNEQSEEYIAVCLSAFSPDIVHRDE